MELESPQQTPGFEIYVVFYCKYATVYHQFPGESDGRVNHY